MSGMIGAPTGSGSLVDELVKVSANDTTSGVLLDKLVAGSGVTLTENNDGGNETVTIAASSTVANKFQQFTFSSEGTTQNAWANVGHPSKTSDDIPYISAADTEAIFVTFSNDTDSAETDVEFYVNAVLQFTWQVRNKRYAWKALDAGMFTMSQGDRLSIFFKKFGSTHPKDPQGSVTMRVTAAPDGEGGSAT